MPPNGYGPGEPQVEGSADYIDPQYWNLRRQMLMQQEVRDRAFELFTSSAPVADLIQEATALGAVGPELESRIPQLTSSGRDIAVRQALSDFVADQDEKLIGLFNRASLIDPQAALSEFPQFATVDQLKGLNQLGLLGTGGGGGGGFAPAPYQFQIGPAGEVVVFNPNTGGVNITGTFPELAQKNFQVVQDPRTGDLVRFDPNTGEQEVLIPDFGFPEIDPRVEFETNVRLQEQQLAAQFAGLELERRGQMIEAFANDMATQISLGRMRYEEASLQLETIDRALNQRRQEREVALQFAVRRSSIRTVDGEQVTVLPGAAQLAALLTQATGQQFTEDFATLPTGQVDPNAAARAVAEAAQFQSPIPGMEADLATNREAINAIVGAPLGTQLVTQQAGAAVTEGI